MGKGNFLSTAAFACLFPRSCFLQMISRRTHSNKLNETGGKERQIRCHGNRPSSKYSLDLLYLST